ncbi:MAG: PAS domain S-box protein [Cyanobacteriota bacterium]|nr:PAS domain S-box protein [Cyanobacteriota bacterium]
MNVDMFAQQVQDIHGRLTELYRGANSSVQSRPESLLPIAFKELGTASEELQVAAETLFQHTEELETTRSQVEEERQRYQELFDFMPVAYLVTDAQGKIQEANRAAAKLLNVEQHFLVDKLLASFIPPQERLTFRSKLARLHQCDRVQEWTLRLNPRDGHLFDAALTVASMRSSQGEITSLRWIVRDITERKRAELALQSNNYDPCQDRPIHFYSKGELIPLLPEQLWVVRRGLVKLTTMSETSEEILIGLVGASMPFSSSMTSLPTYQAIALSENVEVVSISLSEVAASPRLTQALLPQISQRLRQTEALLAISGKRHVKDRLHYLLLFLKQEFGQKVAQGTRLSVRLTHQELADACCTTRVTITRLLGKLQQQGMITLDCKYHIVWTDA